MASLADVIAAAQREQDAVRDAQAAFDAAAAAREAALAEREALSPANTILRHGVSVE